MANAAAILVLTFFMMVGLMIFLIVISKRPAKNSTRKQRGFLDSKGALIVDHVNHFVSEVESFQRRWDGFFDVSLANGYHFPYSPDALVLANLPAVMAGGQPILVHGSAKDIDINRIVKESNELAERYLREMEQVRLHNLDEFENVERLIKAQKREDSVARPN